MITMLGSPRRCCDGITRRETLKAGALSALGGLFSLPTLLRAEDIRGLATRPAKAKSVIVLYLMGGAATQDMWDLKPDAPVEVRGEFKPIATNVPGVHFCEHLPRMAQWMHKAAIVRSVTHNAGAHNTLPSYTGYEEPLAAGGNATKDSFPPGMPAVCEYMKTGSSDFPASVYLPCYLGWGQLVRRPGPYAGFLGKRYDPLFTECSPYVAKPPEERDYPQVLLGEPRFAESTLAEGITIDRLNTRRGLLQQIDDRLPRAETQVAVGGFDRYQQRAFSMLTSAKVRAAFELDSEDAKLRDRYGRNLFGSSSLIARRLVESGVRFVNVTWDIYWERLKLQNAGWDTHWRNFGIMKEYNLPYFDMTYTTLIEDLDQRGLLDETLVVVMSEMGRYPRVNKEAGREHWTLCYSVLLAGAGIRGGTLYGASDAHAAFVKDKPVSTGDICATIYQCLGLDPAMTVPDRSGRPVHVAHGGQPIRDILA